MLQEQIKTLQKNIDRQLDESPLSKKMRKSQIYQAINKSQKEGQKQKINKNKVNSILQTSRIGVDSNYNLDNSIKIQKKSQKNISLVKQVTIRIEPKTQQQKRQEQKYFLLNQNKSLKQQTIQLLQQLQALLGNKVPKKYGINITTQQQPQQIKLKKVLINSQLLKITSLKQKIQYQQKQLQNVYDNSHIAIQQANVKMLEKQIKQLEKQKKAVEKVLKQQNKGVQDMDMTPQFKARFNRTREELQKIKQEYKAIQLKTLQNQRLLRKKHQKAVTHHTKMKKLQKMIKQNNQKLKKGNLKDDKLVTSQMIAQIQNQILQLQQQRQLSQKSWASKLANIEAQLQQRKLQQQRKMLILKQKQKQVRLNDLRLKQLKKFILTQNQGKRKMSQSGDQGNNPNSSEINKGRKRNIKYLQGQSIQRVVQSNQQN